MGLLSQKSDEYVIYIGWYGDCDNCDVFDLDTHRDKLCAVYQFSEGGKGIKSFLSSAPNLFQNFTELQCGKMYWIVLNPGTSSVDIPNFVQTSYSGDESNLGHLQLCTTSLPTPTPTPVPLNLPIYATNEAHDVTHNDATLSFTVASDLQLIPPGLPDGTFSVILVFDTEDHGTSNGYFTTGAWTHIRPSSCYGWQSGAENNTMKPDDLVTGRTVQVTLSDIPKKHNSIPGRPLFPCLEELLPSTTYYFRWVVFSQVFTTLDEDTFAVWSDLGTFTTLSEPTPTPTPVSTQGCCPGQATVVETVGGVGLTEHTMIPLGSPETTILTWKGFDQGGKLCVDLSLSDNWSENAFELTKFVYLEDDLNNAVGTIRKLLHNGQDKNIIYYTDSSGQCYQGDYSSDPVILQKIESSFGETPTPEPVGSYGPMDFDDTSSDYEDLPSESRSDIGEIHGVVRYIPLEGGFYGVVSKSDGGYLHYLPINIQEDLKGHEGSRILIRSSYLQNDAVSIFQWGTLIYVSEMELEVPVDPGGPVGCFKDLRPCGTDGEFVVRDPKLNCNFPPCFFDIDEFYYKKKNWFLSDISSYQYTFSWSCFCPEEVSKQVEITVIDNEIYSIYDLAGNSIENGEGWFRYYTMSDLYEFIELEFKKFPHSMSVDYNLAMNYSLKSWFVDKDLMIMDEELGFYITDFSPLPTGCPEDARQCPQSDQVVVRDPKLNCNFPPCKFDKDEFYRTWKTWSEFGEASSSDAISYEYTFRWICECENNTTQEVRITVISGELEGITDLSGEPVDVTTGLGYYTMTGLYEFIQDELTTFPYLMWFEYDDTTGVLTEWSVDRHPEMADDELGFVASDFTII